MLVYMWEAAALRFVHGHHLMRRQGPPHLAIT